MKQQNVIHTFVLLFILATGLWSFWYAGGNVMLQLIIGGVTTIAYVLWGIVHHVMNGDLHKKVVVEYVLVGLIALVLLATLAI